MQWCDSLTDHSIKSVWVWKSHGWCSVHVGLCYTFIRHKSTTASFRLVIYWYCTLYKKTLNLIDKTRQVPAPSDRDVLWSRIRDYMLSEFIAFLLTTDQCFTAVWPSINMRQCRLRTRYVYLLSNKTLWGCGYEAFTEDLHSSRISLHVDRSVPSVSICLW